jgi:hypothetical protein
MPNRFDRPRKIEEEEEKEKDEKPYQTRGLPMFI